MAVSKFAKIQDDNAGCTGNPARCLKAPDGWAGATGDFFNLTEALTKGWVEDPNCAGFNAATADCSALATSTTTVPPSGTFGGQAITTVGIFYTPGGSTFLVSYALVDVQMRLTPNNGAGVPGAWVDAENWGTSINGTNYNKRVVLVNVAPGTYYLNVRVKVGNEYRDVPNVVLGNSYLEQNLATPGGNLTPGGTAPATTTTPPPTTTSSTATLLRAAVQYDTTLGQAFILTEISGSGNTEIRIVSNGFDSNWIPSGAWGSSVDAENYSLRGRVSGIPKGIHLAQVRFAGTTQLIAESSLTLTDTSFNKRFFPASTAVDRVGIIYEYNNFLFIVTQASQKTQVRIYNASYDSGWKDSDVFGTAIGSIQYNYRSYIAGVPTGTFTIDVRFGPDPTVRASAPDVVLGTASASQNLLPANAGINTGSCAITITSVSYDTTNNRVTAVVSASNLAGQVEYSIDQVIWHATPGEIVGLPEGAYTFYARDQFNFSCKAQRAFTVTCVAPVKNSAPIMTRDATTFQGLAINFGTNAQVFRYLLLENNGSTVTPVLLQENGAGGPRTFTINRPLAGVVSYAIVVQFQANQTCQTSSPIVIPA